MERYDSEISKIDIINIIGREQGHDPEQDRDPERDAILQKLSAQFSAPLQDFYDRRIVFWYDEDRSFTEMVDTLDLPGVKLLKLTEDNTFYAKQLLAAEDTQSNYLVYDPIGFGDVREDWLQDVRLYSESFRADLLSMQMERYRVTVTPENRRLMRAYAAFFSGRARCRKLEAFGNVYAAPRQLHVDMLTILTGATRNTPSGVLAAVLRAGLEAERNETENAALAAICRYGDEAAFWELTRECTGYEHREGAPLIELATHILLSAMAGTVSGDFYRGLEGRYSAPHQGSCYAMLHDWVLDARDDTLYELCREVEEHNALRARFERLDIAALMPCEVFPCINECILVKLMTAIVEDTARVELLNRTVEGRRLMMWYGRVEELYQCVREVAQMQSFYQAHIEGFPVARYEELWAGYQTDYCRMDQYYRRFHYAFGNSLRRTNSYVEDQLKGVAEYVEGLYVGWYLRELSAKWLDLTREELEAGKRLPGVPWQRDFYERYVHPLLMSASASGRVFVLISDGLRYEVACELSERLKAETRGNATVSAMQSVLPSVTKCGMAALLPHRTFELTADGRALCDDCSTAGTQERQKLLQRQLGASVAVTAKNLLAMRQTEKRELIAGKRLIYIYHNAIDVVGEAAATEDRVFAACETAMAEIKNLVRVITNELNGTNILITADHGFLYTYRPLTEADKAETDYVQGRILETDRRYILADHEAEGVHVLRVSTGTAPEAPTLFVPQDMIRFKTGGGMNYVHGGASLQEVAVPVITFKHMRTTDKNYVEARKATVELLSSTRQIYNNVFTLDFYQKEPVGGKVSACSYCVYFTDEAGRTISDIRLIIADNTAPGGPDRVTKVRFTLLGQEYDREATYYLTIREKDAKTVLKQIPFELNIAFANDFDF